MLGTTWQVIANLAQADKAPVEAILPKEGSTGWSDTWMVAAKAKHPNCAYMWMDQIICPKANAAGGRVVRRGAGQRARPATLTADKNFCDTYHAGDEAYFDKIWYWTTPIAAVPRRPHGRHVQGLRGLDPGLDRDQGLIGRRHRTATPAADSGPGRRGSGVRCTATPRLRLAAAAVRADGSGWCVAYLGALAALLVSAFWTRRHLHRRRGQRVSTLDNFQDLS